MPQATSFVFDLDDTLYAESDYVRSGFAAVGRLVQERFGIHGFADACWERSLGGERGRIFNSVLEGLHGRVDRNVVDDLVQAYRSHRPRIELHADARRFLDQAHTPLALITDGPRVSQRAKIEALGLGDRFWPIVVTSELGEGRSKPHPAAFQLVQQALGPDQRFVYVADNPHKDFLAPNTLGWTSIRIQRPSGLYALATALTSAHAPQHTVTSLDEVWEFLP